MGRRFWIGSADAGLSNTPVLAKRPLGILLRSSSESSPATDSELTEERVVSSGMEGGSVFGLRVLYGVMKFCMISKQIRQQINSCRLLKA